MATKKKTTTKKKAPGRPRTSRTAAAKKKATSIEKAKRDARAVVRENLAAIEAEERGATTAAPAAKKASGDAPAKGKATGGTRAKRGGEKPPKRASALDAAYQVLRTATEPMSSKQLIEQMAARGLWTSPGGKTPHATLYAAMIREINDKKHEARFRKVGRGLFAAGKGA